MPFGQIRFNSVVFPAPKKPVKTVTGIFDISFIIIPLVIPGHNMFGRNISGSIARGKP